MRNIIRRIEKLEKKMKQSKPKTNADRIRSMTDEQLVDAILKINDIADHIPFCVNNARCDEMLDQGDIIPEGMCRTCVMNWLKKEVNS